MITKTPYEQVYEFHDVFGLDISNTPNLPSRSDEHGLRLRNLRQSLIAEEYEEYLEGERNSDLVEIADALGDIVYIACGTAVAYGIVLNPDDFPLAITTIFSEPMSHEAKRDMVLSIMEAAYKKLVDAEASDDIDAIEHALVYLVRKSYATAAFHDIPLDRVFNEIHRSNMSKLDPDTGRPIYREDGKVLKGRDYTPPDIASILT